MIRLTDKQFRYTSSEDSQKPNYLRNKFKQIEREQRESDAKRKAETEAITVEQAVKVHVLKGAAK